MGDWCIGATVGTAVAQERTRLPKTPLALRNNVRIPPAMNDTRSPLSDPQVSSSELERLRAAVHRAEQAERLQRALFAISELSSADMEMPSMLQRLHAIVDSLMYARNLFMALYDAQSDSLEFIYMVDEATPDLPQPGQRIAMDDYAQALTWYVVRDGLPRRGSMQALEQQVPGPLRARGASAQDWLGVPLREGSQVRGALVVQSYDQPDRYGPEEQAVLEFVASHVLTAVQRKQSQKALEQAVQAGTAELARANHALMAEVARRQRGERLQAALYRIAERANDAGSMDAFYRAVHEIVGDLINARNCYIALVSEDGQELHFPYYVDEQGGKGPTRRMGRGLTEYVLRTRKPLVVSQDEVDVLIDQGLVQTAGPRANSWLGVPLVCDGRALGVIAVQSYQPDVMYSDRDRLLLSFVSQQIASSLVRRRTTESLQQANAELAQRVAERTGQLQEQIAVRERVEAQLQHQVLHDTLTGLPNRNYLLERLAWLQARLQRHRHRRFAVMFMDVDRFKLINDSMGHHAGDAVLQEIGRRLQSTLGDSDMMARVGGDEFAVLLNDAHTLEAAVGLARRMLQVLDEPIPVQGKHLFASVSIGIMLCDQPAATPTDLLRNADTAMYRAKVNGRRRFELYDAHLHSDALRVLTLESALWSAIRRQEFVPHFQPIVSLHDGRILGYEALVRWQHPTEGLLAPADFLQVAEDSGSMEAIDWQIFTLACETIAAQKDFAGYVGLNVAPRHFRNPQFCQQLLDMLRQAGLPPARLCLEITEGALIDDPERTCELLNELRTHGVSLALDDFGTGYSSLGYLHRFPLLTLKIDRSFVAPLAAAPEASDSASAAVVRAVVALAGSLGLSVVAEGIETQAQADALRALGCHLGQGYLFARPAPLPALIPAPAQHLCRP